MSKKKSYMNPNNSIMKEGIFDNLLKLLKFITKSNTRDIKRDIEVKARIVNDYLN